MTRRRRPREEALSLLRIQELRRLASLVPVEVPSRARKADLVAALSGARRVPLREILDHLSEERLRELCTARGLTPRRDTKTALLDELAGPSRKRKLPGDVEEPPSPDSPLSIRASLSNAGFPSEVIDVFVKTPPDPPLNNEDQIKKAIDEYKQDREWTEGLPESIRAWREVAEKLEMLTTRVSEVVRSASDKYPWMTSQLEEVVSPGTAALAGTRSKLESIISDLQQIRDGDEGFPSREAQERAEVIERLRQLGLSDRGIAEKLMAAGLEGGRTVCSVTARIAKHRSRHRVEAEGLREVEYQGPTTAEVTGEQMRPHTDAIKEAVTALQGILKQDRNTTLGVSSAVAARLARNRCTVTLIQAGYTDEEIVGLLVLMGESPPCEAPQLQARVAAAHRTLEASPDGRASD